MAANLRKNPSNLDALLENTAQPRQPSARPPARPSRKPFALSLREWASTQVAAYRLGLVLGYLSMMYFGGQSFYAGIPTFTFTTPYGWTPIWSGIVVLGGLVGGIGAIKAGAEPVTPGIRVFNRIELGGAILLFLTLGTYAAILLYVGYGYGDAGRSSVGSGFVALCVPFLVRMLWLFLRPRFLALQPKHPANPVILVPEGYELVKKNLS